MPTEPVIFISYRSADRPYAERLRERLVRRFGIEAVFFDKDRDRIPPATDFPQVLDEAIRACEIMLTIVGPGWLAAENLIRLADRKDFVRRELIGALQRRETGEVMTIQPLTVGRVSMPNDDQLPAELAAFAQIQAIAIRNAQDFEGDLNRLICVIDTHCPGLRAWHQNAQLRDILVSKEQSRAKLGQDIAVCQPERNPISREAVTAALNAWWQAWPDSHHAFILVGEEGDGKSWAVASWLLAQIEQDSFGVPVVFAPAHKLAQRSAQGIIAEILGDFQPSDIERWHGQLTELANEPSTDAPLFLLVVDAFNERPSHPWRELFDTLRASPWRERVAMIGLCRKQYWQRLGIPSGEHMLTWKLDPFNDAELDAALAQRGSSRDQFETDVLHWMARPRYFDLAFRLQGRLAEGELTLERLIYEDWRDMLERKQQRPCSHDDMLNLIVGLAEKHRDRRFTIADFPPAVTNDVADLRQQLASAGIFDERSGKMCIGQRHLALALGLVLANAVEESEDQSASTLAEVIATYVEACPESDLQVRVRAMATFHALNTDQYPETGLLALLRAWIDGRNLDEADLEKIAAYLPLRPRAYLHMAEIIWSEANNREAQDAFMTGFLRHRHRPEVDCELRPAFGRWLGFVYPWGYRAYFEQDQAKLEEARQEVEKRLGREATPGPVTVFSTPLEVIEEGGLLRLAQVALAVISHDRAAGYANELLGGLIAATVMDGSHAEFAWVLSVSCRETEGALLASAERLMDLARQGNATAWLAARKVLMNLGNEDARRLLQHIPEEFRFVHPLAKLKAESPCDSYLWLWTEDNYLNCLEHGQTNSSRMARQLKEIALNPECHLPATHCARLHEAGAEIDLSRVAPSMGNTIEKHQLEELEPALCAYSADRYRELTLHLVAQLAVRDTLPRRMLADLLLEHFPVFGAHEHELILSSWRATLRGTDEHDRVAQMFLFPVAVFDIPAAEQFRLLVERGDANGYIGNHAPCFRPLPQDSIPAVVAELESITPAAAIRLYNLLWYITQTVTEPHARLHEVILARFESFDTVARAYAIEVIVRTGDSDGASQIIKTDWSKRSGRNHALENTWGSILLAEYGKELPFDDLLPRIELEWLGYAMRQRGYRPDEMALYAAVLNTIWQKLASRGPLPEIEAISPYVQLRVSANEDRGEVQLGVTERDSNTERFANFTWGGSAGQGSMDNLKHINDPQAQIDRLNSLAQQVANTSEAERTQGNPWFAYSFADGELTRLTALSAAPWRDWLRPVMDLNANARRLLSLCRGFYEKLCSALLTHSPADGAALFRVLAQTSTIRITDAHLGLSSLQLDVFAAPDSPEVESILRGQLEAATSDFDLFEFALLCQHGDRVDWLHHLADEWLNSDDGYDTVRALMLLGFSSVASDGDHLVEWEASHDDSWQRDIARIARKYHQRYQWALVWFNRFMTREDRCEAWAAFRLFLRCVDRRFWLTWDSGMLRNIELWKQDAFAMNFGTIESACTTNEKKWKDKLVGQQVKPDELWPWMENYQ